MFHLSKTFNSDSMLEGESLTPFTIFSIIIKTLGNKFLKEINQTRIYSEKRSEKLGTKNLNENPSLCRTKSIDGPNTQMV